MAQGCLSKSTYSQSAMTTRRKRSAKSPRIEALIGEDRELFKGLLKESLQEVLEAEMTETVGAGLGESHRVSVRLLQPRAGDAGRQAGVAGPARPRGAVLDRAV